MNLSDFGNWSSIIGLVITIITFLLAANVNKKVNGILKSKGDRSYFDKKIGIYLSNLKQLQDIASSAQDEVLFSTKQYANINNVIQLVGSSWDVLMQYERKGTKKKKIDYWEKKFEEVQGMYKRSDSRDVRKLISFLSEFITFLEKEQANNER